MPELTISVVSHAQSRMVADLLSDISRYPDTCSLLEVILTLNVDEKLQFDPDGYGYPITIIRNPVPKGFAANHNQAFARSSGRYFCVINPDVRIDADPYSALLACLKDTSIGVVAPLVHGESGVMEDSARLFPTPLKILCKALGGCQGSDYIVKDKIVYPDWVAGMFMLFRREVFEKLGGFDERYFLYYEDVDLCARLRLQGYQVALCPDASVVHHAHRSSHRDLKYMRWHLTSMLRFFLSAPFLKISWQRCTKRSL
jgi:hypothetical protein